jgi:hypothetical protein
MSRLTDKEWVELTKKTIDKYNTGNLRIGQSYMIALGEINLNLYKEVTATDYDCFYNDNKIVKLIEFLNNTEISPKKDWI